ncbi:solute carrier family 13 member 5-like [Lingula anatina]|uniref:Solute carrier family 13 member 5-like n=1 Tax=Lingula anatina TaxID=7574 RepID=A0A2R2MSV0_LINAN|nr:solute carrier family 13 member 5-like [Lingula anatina]|eukprot:XP_023933336.1 solute carrier family 13 member 5-like [Lingula anatina]
MKSCFSRLKELWAFKKTGIVIFTPLILLFIPVLYPSKEMKCAYGVLIIAIFWMTEVMPLAVTALLPLVLFPFMSVSTSKTLSYNYLKDTNMLFVGGLIVAVAVENWNLHKRIALRVLMMVGTKPKWLMFGFMSVTAFLSMWISNTATTAMMVPIVQAVLDELEESKKQELQQSFKNQGSELAGSMEEMVPLNPPPDPDGSDTVIASTNTLDVVVMPGNGFVSGMSSTNELAMTEAMKKSHEYFNNMCKGMLLCIAHAANIGGTATLTGTPPNLVIKGQVDTLYGSEAGINFSSWFVFAFPAMLLALAVAWVWLTGYFLGWRTMFNCCFKMKEEDSSAAGYTIKKAYDNLGPMSFAEIVVLVDFIALAVLWLTREPEFVTGWGDFFKDGDISYISDATSAIAMSVLLFVLPSKRPNFFCLRAKHDDSPPGPVPPILNWSTVQKKLPWNVVVLLGGGFALAQACNESGLSRMIGEAMRVFSGIPAVGIMLIMCIAVSVCTNVISNVATATIFLPILAELAVAIEVHPLYLMIPATITSSFAFMLPVATPPNAIVYSYGRLTMKDMMLSGMVLNIVCMGVIVLAINSWGMAFYHLDTMPEWARGKMTVTPNITANTTLGGAGVSVVGILSEANTTVPYTL